MAQLKQLDFVKSSSLTEMAYSVTNTLWPDIESYFDSYGTFKKWITSHTENHEIKDIALQKFLHNYFKRHLEPYGFILRSFDLVFSFENDYWGDATILFVPFIVGSMTDILPIVHIRLQFHRMHITDYEEFKVTFMHELTHLEQQCKALSSYSLPELYKTCPPNEPISVNQLMDHFSNKKLFNTDTETKPLENLHELGAYANDFALKLFYTFKQSLKSRSPEERDILLRTKIIPQYVDFMSDEMKQQFSALSLDKQHSFLRQLVRELKELTSRLI